jgi:hypothetical protein
MVWFGGGGAGISEQNPRRDSFANHDSGHHEKLDDMLRIQWTACSGLRMRFAVYKNRVSQN